MSAWLGDGAEDKAEREKAGERRDGESWHPCPGRGAHGGAVACGCRASAASCAGNGKLSAERSSGDADVCVAPRPNGESARDGR